jgi:hypothetical protein
MHKMVFVTTYNHQMSKEDILGELKDPPSLDDLELEQIKKYTVGEFVISKSEDGFIQGKLSVRRQFTDKDFERTDDYEIETEDLDSLRYDDVVFTVYPDMRIITFSSKDSALKFGRKTLSKVIFGDSKKLKNVIFFPEKVLEAKRKGEFQNVWYNGVKTSGKVDYASQYGTEIDEDKKFLDSEERSGIGVEFRSKTGKDVKIAVYTSGSVVKKGKIDSISTEIKVRKEMIKKVMNYSDENSVDEATTGFKDLRDF